MLQYPIFKFIRDSMHRQKERRMERRSQAPTTTESEFHGPPLSRPTMSNPLGRTTISKPAAHVLDRRSATLVPIDRSSNVSGMHPGHMKPLM